MEGLLSKSHNFAAIGKLCKITTDVVKSNRGEKKMTTANVNSRKKKHPFLSSFSKKKNDKIHPALLF